MKTLQQLRKDAENTEIGHDEGKDSAYIHGFYRQVFRAGWDAAVKELTKWHDPKKELPDEHQVVLVKTDVDVNIGFYYGHGEFSVGDMGTGIVVRKEEDEDSYLIIGWRHIHELPDDNEKTE